MSVTLLLGAIAREPDVGRCLRTAAALAEHAPQATAGERRMLAAAVSSDDAVMSIAAVHALALTRSGDADPVLLAQLSAEEHWRREHAAWALAGRRPDPAATRALAPLVADGGLTGMLAQDAVRSFASRGAAAADLASAMVQLLASSVDPVRRRRLVETLGLDPRPDVVGLLDRVASDPDEALEVRTAAISALGSRPQGQVRAILERLAKVGPLATAALLSLLDTSPRPAARPRVGTSLRVAQVFLHGDLDSSLRWAGAGDNGGIASLLVHLGDSLARHPDVEKVVTLSRGDAADALTDALWPRDDRSVRGGVPFPRVPMGDAWEYRVLAEHGIRRQLLASGSIDVVHLRMADVGTLAAADVAQSMGIPIVFTAAPDPHALLAGMHCDGKPLRECFGELDRDQHLWFRARLVERLARSAAALALFPRPNVRGVLTAALGLDSADLAARSRVIPEGIRMETAREARRDVLRSVGGERVAVLDELRARRAAMPARRRDLPLLVTAGRLHPVKGVDRVVAAWHGAPDLAAAYNLLIIGGDLADPSSDERRTLDAIHALVPRESATDDGLILLGHRPHLDTARVFAEAARLGGVYVCGSAKEEFGLAIVEALAAGLVPVAPVEGGPVTYLEDGVTGVLVDAQSVGAIRAGIRRAVCLVDAPGRATRARERVGADLTIEGMADALVDLYGTASSAGVLAGAL